MKNIMLKSYDTIGDIIILKFPEKREIKEIDKKKIAEKLLKQHKNIHTILEKSGKIKGRLRTLKTKFLAGIKKTETIHKESSCLFKLDVEKCYFSPRLSNERLEIANQIKKTKAKKVLIMFSGVSPYSIILSKVAKPEKVVSIELGRECCKYARENVKLNKLSNIEIIRGDVKKVVPKLKVKFDAILMPRPNLKETFLKEAFKVTKKGTIIFYNAFGSEKELNKELEKIYKESRKFKKTIKVLKIKKAGDIAPYKFRWRIDFRVIS